MSQERKNSVSLAKWVDDRQSQGRYFFTREEVRTELGLLDNTFRQASARLATENRLCRIRAGFYVIVPLEYKTRGITPPDWFVADLMAYLKRPYYVGLLSASAYHGASHQRVQQYHVITDQPLRKIQCLSLVIRFLKKNNLSTTPLERTKTSTGMIQISSPEATALDLVAYCRQVGGLDRVMTVLQELGEKLDPIKLVEAARLASHIAYAQRVGWLLEQTPFADKTSPLADWIIKSNASPAMLQPKLPKRSACRDRRWNLWINTDVQGDLT